MLPLLVGLLGALDLEAGLLLRAESRGGLLRDEPGAAATPHSDYELSPELHVAADSPSARLQLEYGPDLQTPSLGHGRQLHWLHHGHFLLAAHTQRGDLIRLEAFGFSGDLTYGRAARLLADADGTVAAFPAGGMLRYSNGDAGLWLIRRTTRTITHELGVGAGYTGPVPGDAESLFVPQWRAFATAKQRHQLSLRRELGFEVGLSAVRFEQGPGYDAVSPGATYRYQLTRRDLFEARGGLQLTRTRAAPERGGLPQDTGFDLMPIGRLGIEHQLSVTRRRTITTEASVALLPFYDPFRAELLPRAVGLMAVRTTWSAKQSLVFFGQVYQALRPMDGALGLGDRQHTLVALGMSLSYPFSQMLRAELGGIATTRHVSYYDTQRRLSEPEALVYAAVSAAVGTD